MSHGKYRNRSADDITRCIERNYSIDYAQSFSQDVNGVYESEGPVTLSYSGITGQAVNWVTLAAIEGEEREQIARTVARYREWKTPFWWVIGPSTRPLDLAGHLLDAGFVRLFTAPGMALDMDAPLPAPRAPEGVAIRHMTHAEALAQWSDIDISAMSPSDRNYVYNAFAGIPSAHAPDWFVAYRGDEPVSRCLTFVGSDRSVVSIHNLYTAPNATRQGIGTAVSLHALDEARSRGCDLAVLAASEPGERIYRKIGFETWCTFDFLAWQYADSHAVQSADHDPC